jgi:hypothetical protein
VAQDQNHVRAQGPPGPPGPAGTPATRGWRANAAYVVAAAALIGVGFVTGFVTHNPQAASTGGLKAPLTGFMDRTGTPKLPWITGQVLNVRWDQLQSVQGAAITANNPIDKAVTAVRAWNAANPKVQRGIRVRLFVSSSCDFCGSKVSWVQSLGGSPITVSGSQGQSCEVGHYWTAVFATAYRDLQTKLASAYDSVPEVRETQVSMASLCYSEPFLHYDWTALAAAGDTLSLDQASYTTMIAAHTVWKQTLQDLSFNPYVGGGGNGLAFTLQEITAFRAVFGSQGVLMNDSLRAPVSSLGSQYITMYNAFKTAGGPISFQTATPNVVGDPATVFRLAAGYGAQSVELWNGYQNVPASVLATGQAELLANAHGVGPTPTPTVTPSPTATPSPTPAPTPQPINNVPCIVTLLPGQQTGTCSGTFLRA